MFIETGSAFSDDLIYISIVRNENKDERHQFYYSIEDGAWVNWIDLDQRIVTILYSENYKTFYMLSEEGYFVDAGSSDTITWEKILNAGVHNSSAKNYGYLNKLKEINGIFYAIGNSGQIYRKSNITSEWVHFDKGILQTPITKNTSIKEMIDLNDISGIGNDLYCCGDFSKIYHFNKDTWEAIHISTLTGHLQEIYYKSNDQIYICGYNGTLLLGNSIDGFLNVCPSNINSNFYSVVNYRNKLYLSSEDGLYSCNFDGSEFNLIHISDDNKKISFNKLSVSDDYLWSIGYRNIFYFNGEKWIELATPLI